MALIPEFVSILRYIRDTVYPSVNKTYENAVDLNKEITTKKSQFDGDYSQFKNDYVDFKNSKIEISNAVISTNKSVQSASASALLATQKSNEIKNLTAQGQTLTAGSQAYASFNPADGKLTIGIPAGFKGDKGDSFTINSSGTTAERALYNNQIKGWSFLDLETSTIYFKVSDASGDWSLGTPFGKGDNGVDGKDGADGVGVPNGGTTNQILVKASNDDYDTRWVNLTVDNIAQLKLNSNMGRVDVLGYSYIGDGGGGIFYWDSDSIEPDNGGTIIQATGISTGRWKRLYSGSVNVKWFGAKGDGINDDTSYVENAFNSLTSNQTLDFGKSTYLFAYNGAKNTTFKAIGQLTKLENITIRGDKATLKIVNHNVDLHGGLMFLNPIACKNLKVYGFNCDMSFIGRNNDSNYYPESGFIYAHNTLMDSSNTPDIDKTEDIEVFDCDFNIRSEYGAYCTTPNHYLGDYNNGGKYYSVFIRGAQSETDKKKINKRVKIHDLYFSTTHEAYCIWVWAFSDVDIYHNNFDGVAPRTSDVNNNTLGGSVPAIRCHRFYGQNWNIYDNKLKGRESNDRVGSKVGSCALIGFAIDYATYSQDDTPVNITNNKLTVGSMLDTSTEQLVDTGIQILCSGEFNISGNTFSSNAYINGSCAIGLNDINTKEGNTLKVSIIGNTFDESCDKIYTLVYSSDSNTSDAARSLKKLVFKNNIIQGFYRSVIERNQHGGTYYGCEFQDISENTINGITNRYTPLNDVRCIPLVIYNNSTANSVSVMNNNIFGAYTGILNIGAFSSSNRVMNNSINNYLNLPIKNGINYKATGEASNKVYGIGVPVYVQGNPTQYYKVDFIEKNGTGGIVNIGTLMKKGGDLLVGTSSNGWNISQQLVGDIG